MGGLLTSLAAQRHGQLLGGAGHREADTRRLLERAAIRRVVNARMARRNGGWFALFVWCLTTIHGSV